MQFLKNLKVKIFEFAKNKWYVLPLWLRQTVVETLETAAAVVLSYVVSYLSGEQSFNTQTLMTLVLKAILKSLRANPNIPLKDYVNDQKLG
jgi:hypothetical protein